MDACVNGAVPGALLFFMFVEVNLSENAAQKGGRLSEVEAELARSQATCARLSEVFLDCSFFFSNLLQVFLLAKLTVVLNSGLLFFFWSITPFCFT